MTDRVPLRDDPRVDRLEEILRTCPRARLERFYDTIREEANIICLRKRHPKTSNESDTLSSLLPRKWDTDTADEERNDD
jgi:hypothetical protein